MLNAYITLPTGGNYFSYLKRISDEYYYDDNDQAFKQFSSLVDGKIDFVEDSNILGQFEWHREIPDGDYVIFTLEDTGGGDVNIAQSYFVSMKQGEEATFSVVNFGGDVLEADVSCAVSSGSGIFKFYSGEDRTLALRINEGDIAYQIALNAIVTVRLPASGVDGAGDEIIEITKDNDALGGVTIDNYDRGEISVIVDEQDTALMKSGDIIIEIQSGSVSRKARIGGGVQKQTL